MQKYKKQEGRPVAIVFLMVDNHDSFFQNLVRYLRLCDVNVEVCRNDELDFDRISWSSCQGIVLSPGPGQPKAAGRMPELIRLFGGTIPILGVCLGHQAIAEAFGASIIMAPRPMHGRLSTVQHDGRGIFNNLKNPLDVTRYHSLVVERPSLPDSLIVSSETEDGLVMGIRDETGMFEGVQFHPEAELTEHGLDMIRNFVAFCELKSSRHGADI